MMYQKQTEKSSLASDRVIKPRAISGFADYTEAENFLLSAWIRTVEDNYEGFGFTKFFPRPLELKEALLAKGGIAKQVFTVSRFPDDRPTDLALPFDRTVPMSIWIAAHQGEIDFPFKRFDIGYSFRGERAQAGRFRGFLQADIDIIGKGTLNGNADAECIALIYQTLGQLAVPDVYLTINSIRLARSIFRAYELDPATWPALLAIIDDIPKVTMEENLKRFRESGLPATCTEDEIAKVFSYAGTAENFFAETGCRVTEEISSELTDISFLQASLELRGIPGKEIVLKPSIVRGLDYYTGIVFETFIKGYENLGSIASGGRYDDLASTFSKEKLPGVGGSIGLTRLFDIMLRNKMIIPSRKSGADILLCFNDVSLVGEAISVATALRAADIPTDLYNGDGNLKKQLGYANAKGIPQTVLVMSSRNYALKNMETGIQATFNNISYLINHLKFLQS